MSDVKASDVNVSDVKEVYIDLEFSFAYVGPCKNWTAIAPLTV